MAVAVDRDRFAPTEHGLTSSLGFVSALFLLGAMAGLAAGSVDWFHWRLGSTATFWIAMLFLVALLVFGLRSYREHLDLFHPVVHAGWWYFFLQQLLPGLLFLAGARETYVAGLLPDRWHYTGLALLASLAGWLGLVAGFHLPVGSRISRRLGELVRIPQTPQDFWFPSLVLYLVGWGWLVYAFGVGLVGYQQVGTSTGHNLLHVAFYNAWLASQIFVWMGFFSAGPRERRRWRLHVVLLVIGALVWLVMSGSKAALMYPAIYAMIAYQYHKGLNVRAAAKVVMLVSVLTLVGIAVNSTYRGIKQLTFGSAAQITLSQQIEMFSRAYEMLQTLPLEDRTAEATATLLARVDGISQLGLVLALAPRYRDVEEHHGVANNILRNVLLGWIPRALWPGKPEVGAGQVLGFIYYGFEDHTPSITYMGDLFRDFGPVGIPFGMMFVGVVLRIIYRGLIMGTRAGMLGIAIYIPLLNSTSYEQEFSIFIPMLIQYVPGLFGMVLLILGVLELQRILSVRRFTRDLSAA